MHFIASANREAIGFISTFLGRVNPMFVEIEQRKKMSSVEKTSPAKTKGWKKCWSPVSESIGIWWYLLQFW